MEAPNFPESQKIQSAHCPGIVMASVLYSGMQNMSSVLHPITQMHKPVVTTAWCYLQEQTGLFVRFIPPAQQCNLTQPTSASSCGSFFPRNCGKNPP